MPDWAAFLAVTLLGVWISARACDYWGHDPSRTVIDEVAGSMASVMLLPKSLALWIIAFLAFRAYDILKLPPAKTVEDKLPGGWGIMLDDVVAGIYAFVLAHLIRILFPQIVNLL